MSMHSATMALSRHILAASLLTLATCAVAKAEADGPDFYRVSGVRHPDVLNLRALPSASAAKVSEIPAGANGLKNMGCQGDQSFAQWQQATPAQRKAAANTRWCKVEYRGLTGWVAGRFLAEGAHP